MLAAPCPTVEVIRRERTSIRNDLEVDPRPLRRDGRAPLALSRGIGSRQPDAARRGAPPPQRDAQPPREGAAHGSPRGDRRRAQALRRRGGGPGGSPAPVRRPALALAHGEGAPRPDLRRLL